MHAIADFMAKILAQSNPGGKGEIRPSIQHFDVVDDHRGLGRGAAAGAFVINKTIDLLVEKENEIMGFDTTQHSESAYN